MAEEKAKPQPLAEDGSKALDEYITKAIQTDFPMLKVKVIVQRSLLKEKDITGVFLDAEDHPFSFLIQQEDPRPLLQRL